MGDYPWSSPVASILSISRRTDIPALYAPWLRRRFVEGYCEVPNPYNAKQVTRVSLRPEDVDAIVFWTRHARPVLDLLPWLDARSYRYVFQYSILGYGPPIERRAPPIQTAVATFRDLAARLPPGAVVWRYDPILVGPSFTHASHVESFLRIARGLEGSTERVVVSVVDAYRKTRRRMGADLADEPLAWPGLRPLLADLARIAQEHGMEMEACAEECDVSDLGIQRTKCVDDRLFTRLFGGIWPARKDPGQRPACRCVPSRDIGMPDSCTFGCAYCYATRSDAAAFRRRALNDPMSPRLIGSTS